MSYLNSSLANNERVFYSPIISWVTYTKSISEVLFGMAVFSYTKTLYHLFPLNHGTWEVVGSVSIFIGILTLFAVAYDNANTEIAVTNKRILYKTGLLMRTVHEISLSKVESVDISQGLVDLICGTGEITITGTGGTKIAIKSIDEPVRFRKIIAEHSNL